MANTTLYDSNGHRNVLLEDFGHGEMVQANQHVIIHDGRAMILDPGGHKVYNKAMSETMSLVGNGALDYIFLSHQDPDIVAALNGWMMTTDAQALAPSLWLRFIPHFGLDDLFLSRVVKVPDEGMKVELGGAELVILPAHFLHSCGNFHVYDPTSKILYSGDLGASLGQDYIEVPDFDAHIQYMKGFHQRYMTSQLAMRRWATMVADLDIDTIAPQHGAIMRGADMSQAFIKWCSELECGLDIMENYQVPT